MPERDDAGPVMVQMTSSGETECVKKRERRGRELVSWRGAKAARTWDFVSVKLLVVVDMVKFE